MKKLDIVHHKFIMLIIILVVLITGILFGVRILDASGLEGLSIITFSMVFLSIVMLFLIFVKITHLSDDSDGRTVKKVKRSRRGQAALEFLTTYGWAILIILVMIGALSFFGVTDPTRYLPDKCVFKVGLSCDDFIVLNDGTNMDLLFGIENSLGETVTIHGATVTNDGNRVVCAPTTDTVVQAGNNVSFSCADIPGNPGANQGVKFSVNITYTPINGNYLRVAAGDISTRVQQ